MTGQWQELKETITEMCDNGGTGTQQEVCQFFANYMEILEKQMQQPCEDCISREAVDEYITNLLSGYLYDEERTRLEDLTAYIWELPSVQPTRPKGRWIDIQYFEADDTYYRPKCPFCNAEPKEYSKFCPNCGADMTELESS